MKKTISFILIFAILVTALSFRVSAQPSDVLAIAEYDDVSSLNLSKYDLRSLEELLITLNFDIYTKWPDSSKLPEGFDPQRIMDWGKDPGLGVKKLHSLGYTGEGVNIAYIDQPLLTNHVEYANKNIRYYKIWPEKIPEDSSMHGPAVLSLLSGKDIGVAPESNVYFVGHPAWLANQESHAAALKKLIEINKTLPDDQKIRIVGFSDSIDPREDNAESFSAAVNEAEESGIMVFTVNTININPLTILPGKDKNDFSNYKLTNWFDSDYIRDDSLGVPTSSRTTANGNMNDPLEYKYWTDGGLSWSVPYIVGVISLGLQIDPSLTKENAIRYLKESAYPFKGAGIINPEGFIRLVEKNLKDKKYSKKTWRSGLLLPALQ